jgi:hypothetical protein
MVREICLSILNAGIENQKAGPDLKSSLEILSEILEPLKI